MTVHTSTVIVISIVYKQLLELLEVHKNFISLIDRYFNNWTVHFVGRFMAFSVQ